MYTGCSYIISWIISLWPRQHSQSCCYRPTTYLSMYSVIQLLLEQGFPISLSISNRSLSFAISLHFTISSVIHLSSCCVCSSLISSPGQSWCMCFINGFVILHLLYSGIYVKLLNGTVRKCDIFEMPQKSTLRQPSVVGGFHENTYNLNDIFFIECQQMKFNLSADICQGI